MKCIIVDGLHLIVHGTQPPTDAQWADYLAAMKAQGPELRELIVSAGPGPTRAQRTAMRSLLQDGRRPTAILVDSLVRRFMIDLWRRFTRKREIRVFHSSSVREALAFLGIPGNREPHIRGEIARLRQEDLGTHHDELRAPAGGEPR